MAHQMSTGEILKVIAEAINEPQDDVRPEVELENLPGWDSMGVLLVMAELDELFGIVLDQETLSSFSQVSDVLKVLKEEGAVAE